MDGSSAFRGGVELRPALLRCARDGFGLVPRALTSGFLRTLGDELDAGPFRRFRETFGQVRQQIDGYDVRVPDERFPHLTRLCRELRGVVRTAGRDVRGLTTWTPNEAGITHYVPGSIGITPHMDGRWYRRLVVVVSVHGRAPFAICGSRDPADVVEGWIAEPGDLVLMRGPGLAGARDGRPFHLAGGPRVGERLSVGIRMAVARS